MDPDPDSMLRRAVTSAALTAAAVLAVTRVRACRPDLHAVLANA
jgi:hypothetical protein